MFSGELKREYYECKKQECHRLKHLRHESSTDLCGVCNLKLKIEFDEKKNKDHPLFKAASYKKFRDRLNWSGIEFPSGQEDFKTFSKNNPKIILSVYREQSRGGGDLYLEYRSPPPPEDVETKAVHLVYATRINLEECELEAHFLSVTKLSQLFGKILQYKDAKGNPFTKEYDRNVCKVCNEIFAFAAWGQGSLKNQVEKVQENFLSETPDERVTKLYSVGTKFFTNKILSHLLRIIWQSVHSILLVLQKCQWRAPYFSSAMLRLFMTNLSPSTLTLRPHMQLFHR